MDKPTAATADEWDNWKEDSKLKHPVKYFIQERIPRLYNKYIVVPYFLRINDWYWGLKYRFIHKHQYHIIRPRTLKPSYHDHDTRILHAVMEEVTEFYEVGATHTDWKNSSDNHANAYKELEEIYTWWVDKWPHRNNTTVDGKALEEYPSLPKEWGALAIFKDKYKDEPIMKEHKRIGALRMASDELWRMKETEMLIRVMKIRSYMWD